MTVLLHSGESFVPNVASIERHLPWIWFEVPEDPDDPTELVRVIAIPETAIAKVDITMVTASKKGQLGFTVEETTDTLGTPD